MPEAATGGEFRLNTPVDDLPGIGKSRARALRRLEIATVADLLRHYPMRYEHEAAEDTIQALPIDGIGSARGVVQATQWVPAKGMPVRGRKGRFQATLEDSTGRVLLTWFNAPWMKDKLHPGMRVRVQGKVTRFNNYPQIANPKLEAIDEDGEAPDAKDARLRPVYPATELVSSTMLEELVAAVLPRALPQVPDPLPASLLEHHQMPPLAEALRMVHQPQTFDEAHAARRRLAFNELLLLQLGIAVKRAFVRRKMVAPAVPFDDEINRHIRGRFPFQLTQSQEEVIKEIIADLTTAKPMNRLLQGDVGAGKTVVALYAMLMAVEDRKQAALMAPTELLAEQHHASITRMLEGSQVRVALLTASAAASGSATRAELERRIADGEVDIVIGTQALLSERLQFNDLAVVVIDEQHRFGVMQRAGFRVNKSKSPTDEEGRRRVPHHLVMTATPIPRTLSLTVFGDLDVSTIRGLPPGRTPITNRVVGPEKADDVYRYVATRLERGEQAYVVVPVIEQQEEGGGRKPLVSVREHLKLLQDKYFKDYRVAAVHGQLKPETRDRVMDRFRRNAIQVLVATTVIEVGVDVPNATLMVIEHAERFGLAQLHQLRGRIGRGSHGIRSLCVFIADPTTDDGRRRMEAIAATNDGFKIAEMDLEIRGMGDFFGTRQHGLPPLRIARIPEDMDLLQMARRDAAAMVEDDPELTADQHTALRRVLLREYGEALGLIDIG